MNRLMTVLGLAAAVLAAGCGKSPEERLAEKLIEKSLAKDGVTANVDLSGDSLSFTMTDADGKQANIQVAGESMTITGPDGVTTFRSDGSGGIPDDFPTDIFVPPGAKVISSMSYPGGANLTLESAESSASVIEAYAENMQAKGWKRESLMDMGEMAMVTYSKENRTASLIVQSEGGPTTINLTVASE